MNKIPVTVQGAELLKAELQRLRSVDRPNVIQAIAEARAQGDLSENAEYDAANAQVIDPKTLNAEGRCVFGATVRIEDMDSGDVATYQIVGDDEADIKGGKISVSSPIARALIGKSEGEVAEVMAPGGIRSYEVLEVQYI